jgi:hypothetical protein
MLIVRNHLPALPALALLFGGGLAFAGARWRPRARRWLWAGVAIGCAANAAWGARAAASIRHTTPSSVIDDLRRDVVRAGAPFRVSARLADALGPATARALRCRPVAAGAAGDVPAMVFLFWDVGTMSDHRINNRVHAVAAFYGPLDANHDWYVTFFGKMKDDRIVGLSRDQARAVGLSMDGYLDCGFP